MTPQASHLPPDQHRRILEEEIIPELLDRKLSHEKPRAILTGGQPGSGKGALATRALQELDGDAVVIDPDRNRLFHPDVNSFRSENPYRWSDRTHADASKWADELLETAIEQRKNVIYDTTLSNGEWSSKVISDLRARGYDVEVRVLASHRLESEHGVDQRFSRALDQGAVARYVPSAVRDTTYDRLPSSLDAIHQQTGVTIRIFNRERLEVYDSRNSEVLPSQALLQAREARLQDPSITRSVRDNWVTQREWHDSLQDRLKENSRLTPDTRDALLREREILGVEEGVARLARESRDVDFDVRLQPRLATAGTALGLGATAYDALTSSARSDALREEGSVLAAQSELNRFAGRNIGGWAGAAAGAEFGLATFGKTPQTAIIGSVVGGVIGSVAGERIADREDAKKIYTQIDRNGVQWRLAGQQWEREELADLTQNAATQPQRRSFSALPEKTSELNYRATNAAVDLASRDQPLPANPFKLAAGAEDHASLQPADWLRNPRGDGWYRDIVSRVEAPDIPVFEREVASPARAEALDAESIRTIASNIASSSSATAARYEAVYRAEGWDRHGPMPTQVVKVLSGADTLTASNGFSYVRGADAVWRHEGAVASGNLERELELTRDALLPALAQHADAMSHVSARATPSPEAQDRSNLTSTYAAFGIAPSAESMDAILLAVERTRSTHGLDRSTTSLSPKPDNDGRYSIHSPIDHLVRHEGVVRVAATTTAEDIQRARDDQTTHREPPTEPPAKAPSTDQRAPDETPWPLSTPPGETSAKETAASPFAASSHPQHALYALLKHNLPQDTSERRLAQFTAECHRGGIGPRSLSSIEIAGEHAAFVAASGWPRVDVSISAPPPSIEESAMKAQQQSLLAQTDRSHEMPHAQAMHH